MTVERTTSTAPEVTASELIDRLGRFDGPPEQFIINLLAVQCHLAPASGGAILRPARQEGVEIVAMYPPLREGATAPVWVAQAAEAAPEVIAGGQLAVRPLHETDDLYGQSAKRSIVMIPLRGGPQGVRGTAAYIMDTADQRILSRGAERLELTISMLSLYEMRLTLQHRQMDLQRLRSAMETLAVVNGQGRLTAAAMALCNELQSRWKADRVSIGLLKGRYVKLKAMSDTEKFDRKTEPVQKIEAAMEECLDQDVEVLYPSGPESTYVSRAHKELSQRFGPSTVLSLPLRHEGQLVGVVTVERDAEEPFELAEIEPIRLACDLCTSRVELLHRTDRWAGAKAAGALRKGAAFTVGSKHTWVKLAILAVLGVAAFLAFARGDYRASSSFVIEDVGRRIVSAPFDGHLDDGYEILVRPGMLVEAGQPLARLATRRMEEELAEARARRLTALISAEDSRRQEDGTTQAQYYEAEARTLEVRIASLQEQIAEATLRSPISGVLLRGELEHVPRGQVSRGDALFEIAPLDALWAELLVGEDMIGELLNHGEELGGELATRTYPDRRLPFVVERINPVPQADEDNVYKVRVRLLERPEWLRPGMEGTAKIHLGRRSYGYLWSRDLVNWVRMRLWI